MPMTYQQIQEVLENHKEEILAAAVNYERKMNETAQNFLDCFITSRSAVKSFEDFRNCFIREMCKITNLDRCTCNFFADDYLR